MKILLIHNYYMYSGGEDIYLKSLMKLLKKNGHKVILYKKESKNIITIFDKFKVAFGLLYNPTIDTELTQLIKKERPDIAHFHNIYPLIGATAYLACHKAALPIVQHIHNYRMVCSKGNLFRSGTICELCPKSKSLIPSVYFGCYHSSRIASLIFMIAQTCHKMRNTLGYIDTYISPSLFSLKYLSSTLPPKKNIVYIPNFVNIIKKNVPAKNSRGGYYLYVGRIVEEKGVEDMILAFTGTGQKLVIIGEGPLKDKLKKSYGGSPNISFIPFQTSENVYTYIKGCTALIIPSKWYEVAPLVFIEAFILKKPIIFRLLGGMIEYKTYGFGIQNKLFTHSLTQLIKGNSPVPKVRYTAEKASHFSEKSHYNAVISLYEKTIKSA